MPPVSRSSKQKPLTYTPKTFKMIKAQTNIPLPGLHQRPIVTDIIYPSEGGKKPVLLFCHGYKGFKDWGVWNLMAKTFAGNGICFVKFNFSHNGGTLEQPIDFPDLEAFGRNTFTKELDDLQVVLDWLTSDDNEFAAHIDTGNITLMGHSRGGGTAIIKASEDARIKKLVTLASVSDFAARFPQGEAFNVWKEAGIGYVTNARTKQQMPHLFSFYEDCEANEESLTISRTVKQLNKSFLIIHGTADPTVDVKNAEHLKEWQPSAQLLLLEGSDHVFGASHPWEQEELPADLIKITGAVSELVLKDLTS